MIENASDFFASVSEERIDTMDRMERIGGHPDGYCELYKCDKGGWFRTLKCLQPDFRGKPLYENLLRKEFEIGSSLSHPHICEYFEWVDHPELGSCIEMEWVNGRTLDQMLAEGRHPVEVYDKIVTEICDALGYIHSKQVLHKDLKPSNILITFNGNNVKFIDFGVSDSDSSSVLKISAGTAAYAAPEVLEGGKATVRSDLYSLGRVLSVLPVRKYAPIVRRLCAASPEKRPGSVYETMRLLKRSTSVLPGVLFIFIVAGITIWLLANPSRSSVSPVSDPLASAPDSAASFNTVSMQVPAPLLEEPISPSRHSDPVSSTASHPTGESGSQDQSSAESTPVDPAFIDEVFHQATVLFDE